MVTAEFEPGAPANSVTQSMLAGLNAGGSMMERAQRMREQQQSMDLQAQQAAILQPAMRAKAQADIAEAGATVDAITQAQNMRTAVAGLVPQARADFHNLMLLPDPNDRTRAGLEWISKYGQLANVGAYKQEFDTNKDVIAHMNLEANALAMLKLRNDGILAATQSRGTNSANVENIKAAAKTASAQIMADARQPEIVKLASALGDAQDDVTRQALQDRINRITNIRPETKSAYIQAVQAYKQATASGDTANAQLYKAQIDKLNTLSQRQPAPAPTSSIPVPAASAAPAAAPAAGASPAVPAPAMSNEDLQRYFFGTTGLSADPDDYIQPGD
ncbi:MAG TPA: hypothetical protein VHC86_10750 [Opitutaceae bacterium]|nr:hypothetical protein [Opitutaceae bacterium]